MRSTSNDANIEDSDIFDFLKLGLPHCLFEHKEAYFQLPTAGRLSAMAGRSSWTSLVVLLLLLQCLAVPGSKHGPTFLQLYAHESRLPPNNTLIVSAAPSGSKTGADEFGLIRTVSNILREGRSPESPIVGSQVGIIVVGKDNANVYISFTYFLNENATHQGTIAVHGHIDGTSAGDRVFAVVGGTGAFLSVTGHDRSAYDPQLVPNPATIMNVHNLTLQHHIDCYWETDSFGLAAMRSSTL